MITLLIKIFKWLFGFFLKHKKGTLISAAGIGAVGAGVGFSNSIKAKKINKRAQIIQQEALDRHEREYRNTQEVLDKLGQIEKTVIDSFSLFSDLIEHIQGRPQFKTNVFSSVKLPNYETKEIKALSTEFQMAVAGAGGAVIGSLAGLAAFGANAIIAAPAMIVAGVQFCVKGVGLKKKAIENERQAKELKRNVDDIIEFYSKLRTTAESFYSIIHAIYKKYVEYLDRMNSILVTKSRWKDFSSSEKKTVENTVLMTKLLFSMVKTNIIIRSKNEEKIESINTIELSDLQSKAKKVLENVA